MENEIEFSISVLKIKWNNIAYDTDIDIYLAINVYEICKQISE